ncbi:MAG: phage tail protein [Desulfovibrionaceae bacterium]
MKLVITSCADDLLWRHSRLAAVADALPAAAARAVNKTLQGLRTDVVREVRGRYNVPAKDVRGTMSIRKAWKHNAEGVLRIRAARSVPLVRFGALPRTPKVKRPRKGAPGVSVKVLSSGGRKPLRRVFVARMRSGHVGVYERASGVRALPIRELHGPSFVPYLYRDDVHERVTDMATDRLWKHLDHEAGRELKKAGLS